MANGFGGDYRREEASGYDPETRAYERELDPYGQGVHTNFPPAAEFTAVDQALRRAADELAEADRLRGEAQGRVQFWPNVGRFVIPQENTYAAHAKLIDSGYLSFDPPAYPYTLQVLADAAQRPDITDPNHPDFPKNAMARRNILAVINDITGMYMEDGAFDPGDEKYIPQMVSISKALGDGLRHEKSPAGRLFFQHLNTEHLNIEGEGAAHLYDFLLERQRSPGIFAATRRDLRRITGLPLREWGLPPKSETPFSKAGLDAAPPPDVLCMTDAQLAEHCRGRQPEKVWQTRIGQQPQGTGYARAG